VSIFLDQNYTVYSYHNISDVSSILYSTSPEGAIIYYEIYQILSNSSQILYKQGTFTSFGLGTSLFTLTGKDLGNYNIHLHSFLENYTAAEINFEFVVEKKPITLLDETIGINTVIEVPQNNDIEFIFEIWDSVHDIPLVDAIVLVDLDGTIYRFYGNDQGVYNINFSSEILSNYDVGTYNLNVEIQKTNYTFTPIHISLTISLPVDPYLNIPYLYWIIIIGTAVLVTSVTITRRIIKNARIPQFLRQLQKTKKIIKKNSEIIDPIITSTREDEFLNRFGHLWEELGLDPTEFREEV